MQIRWCDHNDDDRRDAILCYVMRRYVRSRGPIQSHSMGESPHDQLSPFEKSTNKALDGSEAEIENSVADAHDATSSFLFNSCAPTPWLDNEPRRTGSHVISYTIYQFRCIRDTSIVSNYANGNEELATTKCNETNQKRREISCSFSQSFEISSECANRKPYTYVKYTMYKGTCISWFGVNRRNHVFSVRNRNPPTQRAEQEYSKWKARISITHYLYWFFDWLWLWTSIHTAQLSSAQFSWAQLGTAQHSTHCWANWFHFVCVLFILFFSFLLPFF